MNDIYKYPRTQHIEGSGLQHGDEDLGVIPFQKIAGRHLVVEEKMDGANCAVSFSTDGRLQLQSRGHYLTGGEREKQFNLFKTWASRYTAEFWEILQSRYVMYGEWLYAKHTVFYTDLPHYFMEFDIYDIETGTFLSTQRRKTLLADLPFVHSVLVLYEGKLETLEELTRMIGPSHFITADHLQRLQAICQEKRLDYQQAVKETDSSLLMEGLYVKVEEEDVVKERYKYVRGSFLQTISDSENHWMERPIIPNSLQDEASLF